MRTQKRGRNNAFNQQASVESANGMGGAMNEEDLKIGVIKQQVQANVEDVAALTLNGNIEEQVQTCVDIGETSMVDVNKIEVGL
jgi:hypothetical protein